SIDAPEILRKLWLNSRGGKGFESARQKYRHVAVASHFDVAPENPHHSDNDLALLPLLRENLPAGVDESLRHKRQQNVDGHLEICRLNRRFGKMRIAVQPFRNRVAAG